MHQFSLQFSFELMETRSYNYMFIKVGFYKFGVFSIGQCPLVSFIISLCFKIYN